MTYRSFSGAAQALGLCRAAFLASALTGPVYLATAGSAAPPPPTSQPSTAPTASAPGPKGIRPFQPGVRIDWSGAVQIDSHVVLREGPLEFFACFAGKEHESILRLDAKGEHIALALGLIGVNAGEPANWIEDERRYSPPTGDPIDIEVRIPGGRWVNAWEWLIEIDTLGPPITRPWIFGGSRSSPAGGLQADRSGAGIALVDFTDSLIGLSRAHTSENAGLWCIAATERIPSEGTSVELRIAPAKSRSYEMRLDERGTILVDGRPVALDDLADLLAIHARGSLGCSQKIIVPPRALLADRARIEKLLSQLSVPNSALEWIDAP